MSEQVEITYSETTIKDGIICSMKHLRNRLVRKSIMVCVYLCRAAPAVYQAGCELEVCTSCSHLQYELTPIIQ